MELKSTNKWFWLTISVYLIIGLYLLFIIYSKPFINIEVKEENGAWIITNPYYKEWAVKHQISPGDIVLNINGKNVDEIATIKYDLVIRTANELTLMKSDGNSININIKSFDIIQLFYSVFLVPTIFYLLSLIISIYLYLKPKNTILINLLILFILTVSLAYLSIGASGVLNIFGIIVNRGSMLLCLVLLLHFLKEYFDFLNTRWLFIKNIKIFYVLPLIVIGLSIFGIIANSIHYAVSNIILGLFFLLLVIILSIMVISYIKYKVPQLKILLGSIIIPFIPFLFLYALPKIFFHNFLLSADICSIFLMFIPFSFIFTQLTERIFDMEYYISRLRYYSYFSFIFALWLLLGLYFLTGLSLARLTEIFLFTFLSLMALFYIKERLDYHKRKILFSTKDDYIHHLHTTIDSIGRVVKIEDLLARFAQEVALQLEVEHVSVLTYDFHTHQVILNNPSKEYMEHIDEALLERLSLGDIQKTDYFYLAFIHQDARFKRILVIDHRQAIYLKDEELLWLELLLLYLNNFIENTKMIEELLQQLKHKKASGNQELSWLNKLLWLRFEEEKYQLAQELHDTILQEQLHIAREMDALVHWKDVEMIPSQLEKVHEQMVISLNDLREYCESLKPPLLDTLGLNAALEKLIQKIHKRVDFMLIYTTDRLYLEDERLNLMIYRLFQELLNNALKHAYADTVDVQLLSTEKGFEILYTDDGVGYNVDDLIRTDSMGIRGMQERVQAFNGKFTLDSKVGEGMTIRIQVNEV
ncbi:histidine kinase [Lysinibacillus macroides]|uniref:histidine kinase n=1 Tax=Lysinibacillus macroides TaxID=33935 RepID=A0A0M9DJM9_9BACI|nr:ATP-binding protein [Lysinibacillus macroides]KOY82778.1 histidine kinase [Lysinibacillus macroides]QPR66176.1 histidine kinase [Lysinibacillus macroides]